jgi:L,D-transpeptidase ErfK/SrfK
MATGFARCAAIVKRVLVQLRLCSRIVSFPIGRDDFRMPSLTSCRCPARTPYRLQRWAHFATGWLVAVVVATALPAARAETFLLTTDSDLIGALGMARASYEDTLTDIARRTGLGYEDMLRANPGVDPWLPGKDTEVVLPTRYVLPGGGRQGLVVNIAEYRLYYFTRAGGANVVATFPISIGRMDWATPIGRHRVLSKQARPTWYPPASIRAEHAAEGDILPKAIPPGPENPLGDYAMRLSQTGYLIHGTNKPVGIGMQVTHGCIRMYPEDIEWLFPQVPVGVAVQIVNEPYKFGWAGDNLYLEVHPRLEGDEHAELQGMTQIMQLYVRATERRPARIDWPLVEEVYDAKLGIPVRVGSAAPQVAKNVPQAAAARGAAVRPRGEDRGAEKYPRK